MNCRNCGAAMELFERRRYYFCCYCGSFHFLDTTETDGVRVLETPAQPQTCPVCAGALAGAQLDNVHPVQYCSGCRGVLVQRSRFAEVVQMRRAWATGQPIPPVPLDPRELKRVVACPSCRTKMAVHPYYGPGNVVIDTCDRCNLVWLDFGELKQIADAPGSDRGTRLPPRVEYFPPAAAAQGGGPSIRDYPDALDFLFDLLS